MYKPPQNNNRVRCLRNKFENLGQNISDNNPNNGCGNNLKTSEKEKLQEMPSLKTQINESLKMNIKRTPAFRVDRNQANSCSVQKNCYDKSVLFESKLKLYTSVKNNCNGTNNQLKEDENIGEEYGTDLTNLPKSLPDCKSEIIYENENFIKHGPPQNECEKQNIEKNISSLYTKPIPKALRDKNMKMQNLLEKEDEISNLGNLTISNSIEKKENVSSHLTDTLKTALKKPLPVGPAPKKPPRTFQHVQQNCHSTKNINHSSLVNNVHLRPKSKQKKTDAKYMLNKLENALRNNKLYVKKQCKSDLSNTSGDESDDSPVFKNKFNKINLEFLNRNNDTFSSSTFNFNCLRGINCSRSDYEIINEPSSSFFIDDCDTPTYMEPYHFLNKGVNVTENNEKS